MDHAASLPYVLAKTNFRGRVYMTHPTKAIYKWLMQDSVRVQNTHAQSAAGSSSGANDGGGVNQLFNEQDIMATLPLIQTISFNTTHTHNGIRITPYPAGHVLGACMYLIEIAGLKVLFTGDYSRENDRHLIPASVPRGVQVDCLITESTFGISTHVPRVERESALLKSVTSILNRGGRALLPVFAIGRAQELLLILEDYWHRHEDYRKFPIYYASSLARKCMIVYQTYIDAMNDNIRSKLHNKLTANPSNDPNQPQAAAGPWDFQYIRSLKSLDRFDDVGPCVMLASPGMLQNGVSRSLLERWAPEPKNGVVITGYSVEGTMAKEIMREPEAIPAVMASRSAATGPSVGKRPGMTADGERPMIPRRCTVQEFSFAAHVDGTENRVFIEEVNAPVVILVHGERNNMMRMRSRLLSLGKFKVFSPANCEEVRIPFRREKVARVVGRLAERIVPTYSLSPPSSPEHDDEEARDPKRSRGQLVSGVLVQNDFRLSLMAPEDLREYAGLDTTSIICRQRITLAAAGIELIRWALDSTFGVTDVTHISALDGLKTRSSQVTEEADEELERQKSTVFSIMGGAVLIYCNPGGELELEWEGNAISDGVADAVMGVLASVESSPAAVKRSSRPHHHFGNVDENAKSTGNPLVAVAPEARISKLFMLLEAHFGEDAIAPISKPKDIPEANGTNGMEAGEEDQVSLQTSQAGELARLHALGIPVPGVEITYEKSVGKLWLEQLDFECDNKALAGKVSAVLERMGERVVPALG